MVDEVQSFSGNPFVQGPSSPLTPADISIGLVLEGLAKPLFVNEPPPDLSAFLFSPGKSASLWVAIPASLVDRVEDLGGGKIADIEYRHVRVHMQCPTALESATFLSLWAASLPDELPGDPPGESQTDFQELHFAMRGTFDRWACARCVAVNLSLGLAIAAAVAALGPAIGAATAVSSLMAQFGISEGLATLAVGGASGATIARKMCNMC